LSSTIKNFFSSGASLFDQSDVLLLDHIIIVSNHTVEAAGFIFNNRSRDPKSRSDTIVVESVLMEKLQKWGRDASSIFEGDQLFLDIPVHKDDVFNNRARDPKSRSDTVLVFGTDFVQSVQVKDRHIYLYVADP
jgi:hypothetical protein